MCGLRGWTILSSGTTCYSEALVDTLLALLRDAEDNDPPTIQRLLEAALLTELMKYGAARHLAPYGIDMPTFLSSGTDKFSDERRNELSRLIAEHSDTYDVELIISGWGQIQESFSSDRVSSACIYSVSREGVLPHSDDGFYTCGTGNNSAHAVLSYFSLERHMTLAEAVYRVAAAKFMCERTEGVGPNTVLRVATRRGEGMLPGYHIQPTEIEQIRAVWDAKGAPRMTDEAEDHYCCDTKNTWAAKRLSGSNHPQCAAVNRAALPRAMLFLVQAFSILVAVNSPVSVSTTAIACCSFVQIAS